MTEKNFSYNIEDHDLHDFFVMHNQLSDKLETIINKIELLHILEGCCVELEAYNNKNYELLCLTIEETLDYCEDLTELSNQCHIHMQNMLKK